MAMNFKGNKAIYLQIADSICDQILAKTLVAGDKVPSVRETAARVEVNANTVMRSYEYLQGNGIIYTKRGLGYFVAAAAQEVIMKLRREQVLGSDMRDLFQQLNTLGITPTALQEMYQQFLNRK